jgi:hypothetical protein
MSKMSELDLIAQGVADHCWEILYDSVAWQIADQPVNGDDYNDLHSMVMDKAIEYLYKQNNITNR